MKRLLISSAAALAVLLVLVACGGGEGDSEDSGGASLPGSGTATVSVAEIGDAGPVLVDSNGQALYTADEEVGDVVCTEECTAFWVPLTVEGDPTSDSLPGELGVVERPEGTRQVTYDGRRLYTFAEDDAGEVTGDGFADAFAGQRFTWHVVHPDGDAGSPEESGDDGVFRY